MSLLEEVMDDVAMRFVMDPIFNARVAVTRQIIVAEQRLNPGFNATEEVYAGVALVLAERKVDGGKREDSPLPLARAVVEYLRVLAEEGTHTYAQGRISETLQALRTELQRVL